MHLDSRTSAITFRLSGCHAGICRKQSSLWGGSSRKLFPGLGYPSTLFQVHVGREALKPASSLIPVSIHFMSSCGSGLSCTSTQIDPFQRQALDFLLSLSLATVTC